MAAKEPRPLYAVLELPSDASQEEVKKQYRRLALQQHPDKAGAAGGGAEAFARLALAYEVLGDPQRRRRYDLSGELPQSDSATGRRAGETFLAEYMARAPTVTSSAGATAAEMSLESLENYEVLDVESTGVPDYMRGIVEVGLGYLVKTLPDLAEREVVLLRHFVMDKVYALLAYPPPLDAGALQRGYVITYYDDPLQSGIAARWSDQNGLEKGGGSAELQRRAELRTVDAATVERRQLAALAWHGASAPAAAPVEEKRPVVPGEGLGEERLSAAAARLVRLEPDLGSFDIQRLRKEMARLLGVEPSELQALGSSRLMGIVFAAVEEAEDDEEGGAEEAVEEPAAPAATTSAPAAAAPGSRARLRACGKVGEVLRHDPTDADLCWKLRFEGGQEDWFPAAAVEPL